MQVGHETLSPGPTADDGGTAALLSAAVPIIYTRSEPEAVITLLGRVVAALVAAGCLGVLLIASWLRPDARGLGTHQQLGLAACAFQERTGLPCPSCGFTTAFSLFAHGRMLASFIAQPMGSLLAWATAVTVWAGFYIAISGRPVHRLLRLVPSRYYLLPLLTFALLAWGWKVVFVLMQNAK
jgi:hypothetical protein